MCLFKIYEYHKLSADATVLDMKLKNTNTKLSMSAKLDITLNNYLFLMHISNARYCTVWIIAIELGGFCIVSYSGNNEPKGSTCYAMPIQERHIPTACNDTTSPPPPPSHTHTHSHTHIWLYLYKQVQYLFQILCHSPKSVMCFSFTCECLGCYSDGSRDKMPATLLNNL